MTAVDPGRTPAPSAIAEPRCWLVHTPETVLGPHTAAEVRDLVAVGRIRRDCRVQYACGLTVWPGEPLYQVPELCPDSALLPLRWRPREPTAEELREFER